jgi:hypothetical protein
MCIQESLRLMHRFKLTLPFNLSFSVMGCFPESLNLLICYTYALQCIACKPNESSPMSPKKTTTLSLRVDPGIKEALRAASLREHRSIANMVEVLIMRHCKEIGISIPEQQALFEDSVDHE